MESSSSATAMPRHTDWLEASVSSETLQTVLSFLSMRDRLSLLRTSKALIDEPIATTFASFCGTCSACTDKTPHLCTAKDNDQPPLFWASLLKHSRSGALKELRLARCDALTADVLRSSPFTAAALAGLQVLDLSRCDALGAAGLQILAATCHSLRELRFRDMVVDSTALQQLLRANATTLRVVDFLGCHTLTGDDVRGVAVCQDLDDLSLWGCHNVENAAIVHVAAHCRKLRRVNLRYCHKVDDKLVAALATTLPLLQDLNVRYCYKLSDKAVFAICDALPLLETLNLSQCARITDAAIARIVASLQHLRELRLWGCTKLTSAAVFAISSGMPALRLVDIRSRDKFEAVIGGPTALKFLIQTYRNTLAEWEQAGQVGVFKRPRLCAVAA